MLKKAINAPEWLSRSAVYQINPRTFEKEGTLLSIVPELPKLKELGFRIMYLCPIFEADASENRDNWSDRQKKSETNNPKNPYRMNDYFKIDEEYGSMADLRQFIDASHANGMRVILDLVYLHIGPNADIIRRHPEFAKQDETGNIINSRWHFPYLDFTSPGLREYLWCNMVYYIGELDADGFRCDVGDGVPIAFWEEGRRRMQAIKPDSVLINEGANWDYLLTAFDSSYCWAWHEVVYQVFTGEKTVADLKTFEADLQSQIPCGSRILRDIDNHDTVTDWPARTEIVAGHDGMELIEVLNYTIDGIPMVYAGNELADSANLCMFANRFHMGRFETTDRHIASEDYSVRRQQVMQKLNALKAESDILCGGKTQWLKSSDQVIAFRRTLGKKSILFLGNFTKEDADISAFPLSGTVLLENKTDGAVLHSHGYLVIQTEE